MYLGKWRKGTPKGRHHKRSNTTFGSEIEGKKICCNTVSKDYFKDAESRAEYGEMNVQRIHLQIDQLEDELIGQKQKCKAINDELQQTFNDMVQMYWRWQEQHRNHLSTMKLPIYLWKYCFYTFYFSEAYYLPIQDSIHDPINYLKYFAMFFGLLFSIQSKYEFYFNSQGKLNTADFCSMLAKCFGLLLTKRGLS